MRSTLKLTVVSYAGEPRPGPLRRVDGSRLTVGRANDNDWILPDPEKHLSGHHCIIEQQNSSYLITDTSRNGVFLNGIEQPLGSGRSAVLSHGDLISVGDYLIRVEIEGLPLAAAQSAPAGPLNPFGTGSSPLDGPFGRREAAMPLTPELPPATPAVFAPLGRAPVAFPAEIAPTPLASEPFGGSQRGGPIPDHVAAVETFFRAPEIREPIIPPDWNPLAAEPPAAPTTAATDEPIAVTPPSPANQIRTGLRAEAEAPVRADGSPSDALLQAFLEGAGLTVNPEGAEPADQRMHRYGEIFRELAAGIRDLLASRSLMKAEFRLEQTIIRASDNNPLKFSVDLEQALAALLLPQRPGYAEPLSATRQAIADLKAHEIALIAGTQAAVTKLLAGLAPDEIERHIEAAGMLASVLPAARKARYWEAYEKIYQQVSEQLREDIQGVFRQSFAEAYFDQVKKLK
jgi:type VI secretion system protein